MYWTVIIQLLISVITFLLVALSYWYMIKKRKPENRDNTIECKKYEAILSSYQSIYKLLAYTSNTENNNSILMEERENTESCQSHYYFRKDNILKFLEELSKEFYELGHGIFISPEVSTLLFEYRNILYTLLEESRNRNGKVLQITNPKLVQRMKSIHAELSVKIRQHIGL
jgi:hypothetical protein